MMNIEINSHRIRVITRKNFFNSILAANAQTKRHNNHKNGLLKKFMSKRIKMKVNIFTNGCIG